LLLTQTGLILEAKIPLIIVESKTTGVSPLVKLRLKVAVPLVIVKTFTLLSLQASAILI
jgi:hypothetical protein